MSVIDWNKESQGGDYEVLPEGVYQVRVLSWEKCDSKKKGTPQIKVNLQINDKGPQDGKKLSDFIPLTENSLWRVARFVSNCGVDLSKTKTMEVGSQAFQDILQLTKNRNVIVDVIQDSYQGKVNNKINGYSAVAGQSAVSGNVSEDVPSFLKDEEEVSPF